MSIQSIYKGIFPVLLLMAANTRSAYAQEPYNRPKHLFNNSHSTIDHFNFVKSSESLKYTVGYFSTNIRPDNNKTLSGISAGLFAGSGRIKLASEFKFAKSNRDSITDANVQFLYYPMAVELSPYCGIGIGSATREIDGITSTSFFQKYDAKATIGLELFTSSDYRIYIGANFSLPLGKFEENHLETTITPDGKTALTVKHVEGRRMYTDIYLKIGF